LKTYGITTVQSDKYAGAWVVEAFSRHGIAVVQDAEPKSALYLAALPVLTAQRCDLLDVPRLRSQLTALERRRRAGGRDIVDHPLGGHDDVSNAVVGAITFAAQQGAPAPPMGTGLAARPYRPLDFRDAEADWRPYTGWR
jgi:hypothetical protein